MCVMKGWQCDNLTSGTVVVDRVGSGVASFHQRRTTDADRFPPHGNRNRHQQRRHHPNEWRL